MNRTRVFSSILTCAVLSGCGSSVPTTPTESRFTGAWAGTTFQGRPIAFTVSAEQRITSITVDYAMNGCTGSKTLSDLTVSIGQPGSLMKFAIVSAG